MENDCVELSTIIYKWLGLSKQAAENSYLFKWGGGGEGICSC